MATMSAFSSLYDLYLERFRLGDFANLRRNCWMVDDESYLESFRPTEDKKDLADILTSIGDLGFSGSVRAMFLLANSQNCC
jgi:hypothetical protein